MPDLMEAAVAGCAEYCGDEQNECGLRSGRIMAANHCRDLRRVSRYKKSGRSQDNRPASEICQGYLDF